MFAEVLPAGTKSALALLEKNQTIQNSYLAGGTGLALQLGHRISRDLGFFTCREFRVDSLLAVFRKIPGFAPSRISEGTVLGSFDDLKFSIFHYEYPLLEPVVKFNNTDVAAVRDIGAMKMLACASRGTRRDFIDLYFICRQVYPLKRLCEAYDKKYGNLNSMLMHIKKSLVYFEDAEADEMPLMLVETCWEEVKKFFISEVRELDV